MAWLGSGSRSVVTVSATKPKKSTTATKKTATAASKAKKTTTKTKKATPAKKKKKKVAKKTVKSVRRPKKELTPEQKDVLQLRALKKKALFTEPKTLAESPWTLYVAENRKGVSSTPTETRRLIGELAASYKALPSFETSVSFPCIAAWAWLNGILIVHLATSKHYCAEQDCQRCGVQGVD
jgi:hypothetical protein